MTPTNPTDAQMKLADVTQADREAAWPFRAECYGHGDKAGWMRGKYDHVPVIKTFARHRQATEARAQGLVDALEPLAKLEFPQKPSYNAGAYSIFHKDILAARQALATWRRT